MQNLRKEIVFKLFKRDFYKKNTNHLLKMAAGVKNFIARCKKQQGFFIQSDEIIKINATYYKVVEPILVNDVGFVLTSDVKTPKVIAEYRDWIQENALIQYNGRLYQCVAKQDGTPYQAVILSVDKL